MFRIGYTSKKIYMRLGSCFKSRIDRTGSATALQNSARFARFSGDLDSALPVLDPHEYLLKQLLRLKPIYPLFATILVLGVMLLFLTQEVLAGWATLPGEAEKQGAVYLWPGYGDLSEDVKDCLDQDRPRDDRSDKLGSRNRRRKQNGSCGHDDFRRVDSSRPCGKAWSG